LNCTPGGSTGGGAAALATGLSPLELGSDIGGSIRLPSYFCGVFGFKPTEHRVSTAGHIPAVLGMPHIRHILTVGALARSLEDLRAPMFVNHCWCRQPPAIRATSASRSATRAIAASGQWNSFLLIGMLGCVL